MHICPPNLYSISKYLLIFFLLTSFDVSLLFGQGRLELLNADVSRGVLENGELLRILEGNVHARQDTIELFCDLVTYYQSQKKAILEKNVKIVRGKGTLTAATVTYFEDEKLAIAKDNVHVWHPGQELFTDYLEYYYESDYTIARQGVEIRDSKERVTVTAEEGEYNPSKNLTFVEKNAHLFRVDSSGTDTLHIFARRMEYIFGENPRAIAKDSVRIIRENLNAACDSAVYKVDEEIAFLEIHPRAIQENNKMTGLQMQMKFENLDLREIRVRGDANVINVLDSTSSKQNELAGKEIIMYINNRQLDELWAISNARSFYHIIEKDKEKGFNSVSADTIKLFFVKGTLDSIDVKGGSRGTFYPPDYQGKIE
jgi:lipopolysaccharide export system protein LptA